MADKTKKTVETKDAEDDYGNNLPGQEVDPVSKEAQSKIDAGNKQLEQLTVNDLIVIKNVFDACSQRGAFKADEFQTVGAVYTKLSNFLTTIMPPKQPEGESAEEPTGEETKGDS